MDKIRPVKLTFEFLKETVDTTMKKLLAGDWTETHVKKFCSSNGINASGTKHNIDRINNELALADFTSHTVQATDSTNAE